MPLDETRTAGEAGHLADHNDLHAFRNDFSSTSPTDGQTLVWNATSGQWVPSGASASPRQVTILHLATPKAHTNWDSPTRDAISFWSGYSMTSSGAVNNERTDEFVCDAGTYTLDLFHKADINRGIYTFYIGGTSVGTIDGYAASSAAARGSITGIAISAGAHELRVVMATKNAASSAHYGTSSAVTLVRTGA